MDGQKCQKNSIWSSTGRHFTVAQQPLRWQKDMISLGVPPLDESAVDDGVFIVSLLSLIISEKFHRGSFLSRISWSMVSRAVPKPFRHRTSVPTMLSTAGNKTSQMRALTIFKQFSWNTANHPLTWSIIQHGKWRFQSTDHRTLHLGRLLGIVGGNPRSSDCHWLHQFRFHWSGCQPSV